MEGLGSEGGDMCVVAPFLFQYPDIQINVEFNKNLFIRSLESKSRQNL